MSNNYWKFYSDIEYPQNKLYGPEQSPPEYPYIEETAQGNGGNQVYEAVRDIFIAEKFDSENIGTKRWNPLGEYICQGNTVLLKPNLVNHRNPQENDFQKGLDCMITHPSIVRVLFDYVYIALKGKGEIIIADAPVQDCDFEELLRKSGYKELFQFFKEQETDDLKINIADLREIILYKDNGRQRQCENKDKRYKGIVVDLKEESYFNEIKDKNRLRVTNYASKDTVLHHKKGKNEYSISEAFLKADVVFNIVKPKTHRIAGYTAALKNMIGVNTRKEYLPHHQKGRKEAGGDEYTGSYRLLKFMNSWGNDIKNWGLKYQYNWVSDTADNFSRKVGKELDGKEKNRKKFGMWYGNDTIWRTILDINRIVYYSDEKGRICREQQKKILHFGDMIVSGEREGPLRPAYKKVGGILFSDNPVAFDLCVVRLMGYDYKKFPTLCKAAEDRRLICEDINKIVLHSNNSEFDGKLTEIQKSFCFEPSSGWKDFL